jgi:hypothetical protein
LLLVSFFSLLTIENLQQNPLNFREFKILKFSFWRNFAPRKKERKNGGKKKRKEKKKGCCAAAAFFFFRLPNLTLL